MIKKSYNNIGETMITKELANGLTVYFIPKTGYTKKYACFAVNYGSVDARFTTGAAKMHVTPEGVAHFLEHKLFENEHSENALQQFANIGASPNAFTSHGMTAYHFECSERFEENLDILLSYVQEPYFTKESVEKEQGIIGQEIKMVEDDPDWVVFCNLLAAMYETHPIKNSIIGTVESIADITDKVLYDCYNTFYVPKNMVLCITGDLDSEEVFAQVEKGCTKTGALPPEKNYGEEKTAVHKPRIETKLAVEIPKYLAGFKCSAVKGGEEYMRQELLGELTLKLLIGESAPLYKDLYREGLINRDIQSECMPFHGGGTIIIGGESKDGKAVFDALVEECRRIAKDGLEESFFTRIKKALYGSYLRSTEALSSLATRQCFAHFAGYNIFELLQALNQLTKEDAEAFIRENCTEERAALSEVFQAE